MYVRRVSPRSYLFTVCDENVTVETSINLSNNEGEEAVSPFIGAPSIIWTKVAESREHNYRDIYGKNMTDDEGTSRNVSVSITTVGSKKYEEAYVQGLMVP